MIMTKNVNPTVQNESPPTNGLENGNGKKSAAGLIVSGLVVVVGSWIGMAAYMDYRLQGIEKRINADAKHHITAVAEKTNKSLSKFGKDLETKINDTSSILAKGLLDIKETDQGYHTETLQAIEKTGSEVAQVASSNQDIVRVVQTLGRTSRISGEAILTAVQNLDSNIVDANTGLLARIDQNNQTLEDLVKLSNNNTKTQLAELASSVNTIANGSQNDSQKISDELSLLADKISNLGKDIDSSNKAVSELCVSVPQLQKDNQQQMYTITESTKTTQKDIQSNIADLQTKVNQMNASIDSTSESMMRALYITSEGMEGTKVEIKSQLENSKKQTTVEIGKLVQSLRDVSSKLDNLKQDVAQTPETQSSYLPIQETPQFEKLTSTLQGISKKTNTLRSQIDNQVKEVKARTETLFAKEDALKNDAALREMLHTFTSLADTAGGQLDSLLERLESLDKIVAGLCVDTSNEKPTKETAATVPTQQEETKDKTRELSMQ
jgi:hypothetical protein